MWWLREQCQPSTGVTKVRRGLSQALWDPLRTLSWVGRQQVLTVSRERWRPAMRNTGGASPAGKMVLSHPGITDSQGLGQQVHRCTEESVTDSASNCLDFSTDEAPTHSHRLLEAGSSQEADA